MVSALSPRILVRIFTGALLSALGMIAIGVMHALSDGGIAPEAALLVDIALAVGVITLVAFVVGVLTYALGWKRLVPYLVLALAATIVPIYHVIWLFTRFSWDPPSVPTAGYLPLHYCSPTGADSIATLPSYLAAASVMGLIYWFVVFRWKRLPVHESGTARSSRPLRIFAIAFWTLVFGILIWDLIAVPLGFQTTDHAVAGACRNWLMRFATNESVDVE